MSCLTQNEREALEDIFLSISSTNPTPFERCKALCSGLVPTVHFGVKHYIFRLPKKANHFFSQKRDFLKHRFHSLRHH
jgi:hypothetical protein